MISPVNGSTSSAMPVKSRPYFSKISSHDDLRRASDSWRSRASSASAAALRAARCAGVSGRADEKSGFFAADCAEWRAEGVELLVVLVVFFGVGGR